MSRAGSTQPLIPRLAVGTPKQTTSVDAQVLNKTSSSGNGDVEIGRRDEALQPTSPTLPDEAERNASNDDTPGTASNNSASLEADPDLDEQEQLLVKYNNTRPVTPPSEHPMFAPINFEELTQIAASAKKSKSPNGSSIIKQESGEAHGLPPPGGLPTQASISDGPKIKDENGQSAGDHHAAPQQPLSEPANELDQVNVIKDELKSEEQQQVEHEMEVLADDDMDIDMRGAVDDMHVPDEIEDLNRQSDTVARQPDDAEQAGVGRQSVEHQEAGKHGKSPANSVPEQFDGTFLPGGFEMDDLLSSKDLQPQQYIDDQPQPPQRGQDHQLDDHNDDASGSDEYEYDEEYEDEFDEEPRELSAGPSNFQDLWNQRHQMFTDPVQISRSPVNSHLQTTPQNTREDLLSFTTPASQQTSQQPTSPYDENGFSAELRQKQKEIQMRIAQINEAKKQFEISQPTQQTPGDFGFAQNQMGGSFPMALGPIGYERAPPGFHQHQQQASYTPIITNSQYPNHHPMSYGLSSNPSQMPYPAHGYNMPGTRVSMPPDMNNQMLGSFPTQEIPGMGWQESDAEDKEEIDDEHDCGNEGEASDDDEPLRTRVKRHASVMSQDTVMGDSTQHIMSGRGPRQPMQDSDSDMEITGSRILPNAPKGKVTNPVKLARPLPLPKSIPIPAKNAFSDGAEIDWSLPEYEVQVQPFDKKEDLPSAKVSIPGLVREEIILSPDHADQETHLLLNLFIPGQQSREVQEPEPAVALLNFHTIATMVIEAYHQFEIGDEFGTGRGHFHASHDQGEEEYEHVRDAKDANVDEIFFAVVDRWRAGMESKKQSLALIRGAQEFCDVALDVIYYIKEHGLLKPEPKGKRERSDKGVRRGPQKATATAAAKGKTKTKTEGEAEKKQGTKRGTAAKPNEVSGRKKAKVEVKKKRKPKTPGITIIPRTK
jgi:hypothetical protein